MYTEFRICERFNLDPIKFLKEDYSDQEKLLLFAYEQIRSKEEYEEKVKLAGLK